MLYIIYIIDLFIKNVLSFSYISLSFSLFEIQFPLRLIDQTKKRDEKFHNEKSAPSRRI